MAPCYNDFMPHSHSPAPQNLIESSLANSMSSRMEPEDCDASQNAGICALEELLHQGAKVDFSHPLFNEKSRGGLLLCPSRTGQMPEDLSDCPGLLEPPADVAQAIALGTRDRIDRDTSASHGRKPYRRV